MEIVSVLPQFLSADFLGQPVAAWLGFVVIIVALLAFDLGFANKGDHEIGISRSLVFSALYIGVALLFGGWVWWQIGPESGMDYLTGFVVEKSLALDNIFVISLIFTAFAVPRAYQHRVLFWGIVGVVVLRAIMIGLGAALISQFGWILYVFGAFLILTGIKMLIAGDDEPDIEKNRIVRLVRKFIPVTRELHGNRFFVRVPHGPSGKLTRMATPLFLALITIEIIDIVFAVDSVPAVFAITTDPFIVYTSNIFAILGLRALYFALAAAVHRFHYLKYALALVLIVVGAKIFWAHLIGPVDSLVSLGLTVGLLAGGVIVSLWRTRDEPVHPLPAEKHDLVA
ncbi:TerC family protein [Mesorhizobium sp. BR1-1-16]|uniref:TerC family protein n=1 Tax=Mesorhizobium sp. BR1-1-16 TaxID=2876653 RepID=UPI001CC99DB1|nr:TerC family protein [Mesorhizobium sp. BR1-1-16]MBZ9937400.1 TerC family protein [Mesorhizobium sp. BR1-1-16]